MLSANAEVAKITPAVTDVAILIIVFSLERLANSGLPPTAGPASRLPLKKSGVENSKPPSPAGGGVNSHPQTVTMDHLVKIQGMPCLTSQILGNHLGNQNLISEIIK